MDKLKRVLLRASKSARKSSARSKLYRFNAAEEQKFDELYKQAAAEARTTSAAATAATAAPAAAAGAAAAPPALRPSWSTGSGLARPSSASVSALSKNVKPEHVRQWIANVFMAVVEEEKAALAARALSKSSSGSGSGGGSKAVSTASTSSAARPVSDEEAVDIMVEAAKPPALRLATSGAAVDPYFTWLNKFDRTDKKSMARLMQLIESNPERFAIAYRAAGFGPGFRGRRAKVDSPSGSGSSKSHSSSAPMLARSDEFTANFLYSSVIANAFQRFQHDTRKEAKDAKAYYEMVEAMGFGKKPKPADAEATAATTPTESQK